MRTDTTTLDWADLTHLEPRLVALAAGVASGAETLGQIMLRVALKSLAGRFADHPPLRRHGVSPPL